MYKASKSATEKWLEAIGVAVLTAAALAVAAILTTWPTMIALGIINHQITSHCPALGFGATYMLSWAFGAFVAKFRTTSKSAQS